MERKSILGSKDKMSPYSRIRLEFFTKAAWKERPYIMKSNWCEIANIIWWSCIGVWKVVREWKNRLLMHIHVRVLVLYYVVVFGTEKPRQAAQRW